MSPDLRCVHALRHRLLNNGNEQPRVMDHMTWLLALLRHLVDHNALERQQPFAFSPYSVSIKSLGLWGNGMFIFFLNKPSGEGVLCCNLSC